MEMEIVSEKYLDVISCEFAYDPVRLPLDQDASQCLYNRKTLEAIWETKRDAQNPFTRQWFNAKSAIPQTELRQEMEGYIKLQKFSTLDVIEEYTKILEEGDMKEYLDKLGKCLTENVTTKEHWCTVWKKVNLLRMYCQFHSKNIETFRSLHGFRYFKELIFQITILRRSKSIENDTKETAWDVCKEICRAIDVIGLKPLDIIDAEKPDEVLYIIGFLKIIDDAFLSNESGMKIQSLMLRIFCKIFDEMSVHTEEIIGKESYENIVRVEGHILVSKLCEMNAKNISSEDLNHAISILRRTWITTSSFHMSHSQRLATLLLICIVRETDSSREMKDRNEGQFLETEAMGRHNSEALEKGLRLVKDILTTEGPAAADLLQGGSALLEEIVPFFKHFIHQGENSSRGGCKIFQCVHFRIARLALDITTLISRRMPRGNLGVRAFMPPSETLTCTLSPKQGHENLLASGDLTGHNSSTLMNF